MGEILKAGFMVDEGKMSVCCSVCEGDSVHGLEFHSAKSIPRELSKVPSFPAFSSGKLP